LSTLKIPTAKIFEPLLVPARYKGVYGGRGSGKSHFLRELLVETCQVERGTLAVCIREAQRTLAQSSKRLIGLIIFRGMQSYTFKAVITIIVSGFVGAVWLGVKVLLGK
jgi:phage terminase large subunit